MGRVYLCLGQNAELDVYKRQIVGRAIKVIKVIAPTNNKSIR